MNNDIFHDFVFFAGCHLLFTGETAEDRFAFLPYQKSIFERDVHVPTNQRCSFYYGDQFYVQYLDCTGSWRSITTQSVLDTLELTPGWSTTNLKIGVSQTSQWLMGLPRKYPGFTAGCGRVLKELCCDIFSHFCEVQNHVQTEESLKIIVYSVR